VSLEEVATAALLKLEQEDEDLQNLHSMLLTSLCEDNTRLSNAVTISAGVTFNSRISCATLLAQKHTYLLAAGEDLGFNQSQPSLEMDDTYSSKMLYSEIDPESKSAGNQDPGFSQKDVDVEVGSATERVAKEKGETAGSVNPNSESFVEEINQLEEIPDLEHFGEKCFPSEVFGQASISEGPSVRERKGRQAWANQQSTTESYTAAGTSNLHEKSGMMLLPSVTTEVKSQDYTSDNLSMMLMPISPIPQPKPEQHRLFQKRCLD